MTLRVAGYPGARVGTHTQACAHLTTTMSARACARMLITVLLRKAGDVQIGVVALTTSV